MKFAEAILYIGLSQSLFAAFALVTKRLISLSDRIMIACLLTIGLKFLILIMYNEHSEFFDMEFSLGLIPLTFGPFLYLYTTSLVEGRNKFRKIDFLHFVPFLAVTITYFIFFKDEVNFSDTQYLRSNQYLWVRISYAFVFFSSIMSYTVLTFLQLRNYRMKMNTEFSYRSPTINLLWLNFIAVLFSFTFIIYFVVGSINAVSSERVINTAMVSHIGLTILAFCISYFGLKQPLLFRYNTLVTEETDQSSGDEKTAEDDKEIKPKLSEDAAVESAKKLERIMADEKPYLNAELTLQDLALLMNLNKPELTYLLNTHIGKNFFTYVNEYRLEAVIRKLKNPDFDHLTIIAIAFDCGFNSKSTFNSLFKQHTELTPSAYKKQRDELNEMS